MSFLEARFKKLCAITCLVFAWNAVSLTGIAWAQADQTPATPPAPAAGEDYATVCGEAEAAAKQRSTAGYAIAGFLVGIIGFAIAAASSPEPPPAQIAGKSSNYVQIYTQCYEKKAHKRNMSSACGGWAVGAATAIALIAATSSGSSS